MLFRRGNWFQEGGVHPLIIALIVVWTAALLYMMYDYQRETRQQSEELRLLRIQEEQARLEREESARRTELLLIEKRKNDSFYQKLADGFDVRVLVVGDSIGNGRGADEWEDRWPVLLQTELGETYGVDVSLENISMDGNTSFAGYARTAMLETESVDCAIICYGANDSPINFSVYYESLIRVIQKNYPNASVISVLESTEWDEEGAEKMNVIRSLANHYGISVADTVTPFRDDYDSLVVDDVHPNVAGQRIYADTLEAVIMENVDAYRGFDTLPASAVSEYMEIFDTFQWFPAEQFTRIGNTFSLETSIDGVILAIDYEFIGGGGG